MMQEKHGFRLRWRAKLEHYPAPIRAAGFTLIELSIVLVIIGLLVGGVLVGQDLIKAAENRAVIAEYQEYETALNTFKLKYNAIPGDMKNATSFWGYAGGNGTGNDIACLNATGTGTQTCNGDGNRILKDPGAIQYSEIFTFWQHLANADLMTGEYTGKPVTGGIFNGVAGVNLPKSRAVDAIWSSRYLGTVSGDGRLINGFYPNAMVLGTAVTNSLPTAGAFTGQRAYEIDSKIDDGIPYAGRVVPGIQAGFGNGCTLAANASDTAAAYNLSSDAKECFMYFFFQGGFRAN